MTLVSAVSTYYPEDVDLNLRPIDRPQSEILDSYDFIVVGAGSAGSIVASRLSENPSWNVLLLEAGGQETALTDTPFLIPYLENMAIDWNYTTTQQARACLDLGGFCEYHRGHVMGGTSTVNGMMYVRGNQQDYNEWEADGNPGWGYGEVLPYFLKSENITIPELVDSPFHATGGPMWTQFPRFVTPLASALIKGAGEIGVPWRDYNGASQFAISRVQSNVKGPSRESTSKGYLNPTRNRTNLHVAMNSRVTRIIFDSSNKVAVGIEYIRNGQTYLTNASREVIISAGATNTPQILMLSGIGPAEELEPLGISVISNLPVGKYLRDHIATPIFIQIDQNITVTTNVARTQQTILDYAIYRNGPLTSSGFEATMFVNQERNASSPPNIQFLFVNNVEVTVPQDLQIFTAIVVIIRPESVGSVTINSTNPFDPPLINPNFLVDPRDTSTMLAGISILVDLLQTDSLQTLSPKVYPGFSTICQDVYNETDLSQFFRCQMAQYSGTLYHPASTARMGPDPSTSVVNSNLTVHGFRNLRVIDASIMPRITRGNTNAPTMMIGERGADLIASAYS